MTSIIAIKVDGLGNKIVEVSPPNPFRFYILNSPNDIHPSVSELTVPYIRPAETDIENWGTCQKYISYDFRDDVTDALLDHLQLNVNLRNYLVCWAQPARSLENKEQLAIFPDYDAFLKGEAKRMRGKPGRMLRRLFPSLSDPEIEYLANVVKKALGGPTFEPIELTGNIHSVYCEYIASGQNPQNYKDLNASCMNDKGATKAYESGDFKVATLYDTDNKLHARALVGNGYHGPIYAVSDTAGKLLEDWLEVQGISEDDGDWEGLRLYSPSLRCPYVDNYETASLDGDYLVIDKDGPYGIQETGGYASEPDDYDDDSFYCQDCDDRASDGFWVRRDGSEQCVCAWCRDNNYTWVSATQECVHDDNTFKDKEDEYQDRYTIQEQEVARWRYHWIANQTYVFPTDVFHDDKGTPIENDLDLRPLAELTSYSVPTHVNNYREYYVKHEHF